MWSALYAEGIRSKLLDHFLQLNSTQHLQQHVLQGFDSEGSFPPATHVCKIKMENPKTIPPRNKEREENEHSPQLHDFLTANIQHENENGFFFFFFFFGPSKKVTLLFGSDSIYIQKIPIKLSSI